MSEQIPEPQNAGAMSNDALLERIVELEKIAAQQKADQKKIADLEAALAASQAGREIVSVPEHAGGPGTTIAPTWSQYEQDLARRGLHPSQLENEPVS